MILKLEEKRDGVFLPTPPFWTGVHRRRANSARHFQRDYIMRKDEHLWLKSIYIFFFFWKWQIVWLDIRPLFLGWDRVELFEAALKLQFEPSTRWSHRSPLYGEKSWNVILKNLCDWRNKHAHTSWMTWGWVNFQNILNLGSELIL